MVDLAAERGLCFCAESGIFGRILNELLPVANILHQTGLDQCDGEVLVPAPPEPVRIENPLVAQRPGIEPQRVLECRGAGFLEADVKNDTHDSPEP